MHLQDIHRRRHTSTRTPIIISTFDTHSRRLLNILLIGLLILFLVTRRYSEGTPLTFILHAWGRSGQRHKRLTQCRQAHKAAIAIPCILMTVIHNPDLLSDNPPMHKEHILNGESIPICITEGSNLRMPRKKLLKGCPLSPLHRPYGHLIGKLHRWGGRRMLREGGGHTGCLPSQSGGTLDALPPIGHLKTEYTRQISHNRKGWKRHSMHQQPLLSSHRPSYYEHI